MMTTYDIPKREHEKMEHTFWKLFREYDKNRIFPKKLIQVNYCKTGEDDETQPNEYLIEIHLNRKVDLDIMWKNQFTSGLEHYLKTYPNLRSKEIKNTLGFLDIVGYLVVDEKYDEEVQ